jgi:hypothetical protein
LKNTPELKHLVFKHLPAQAQGTKLKAPQINLLACRMTDLMYKWRGFIVFVLLSLNSRHSSEITMWKVHAVPNALTGLAHLIMLWSMAAGDQKLKYT